jgi:hypothetical protein
MMEQKMPVVVVKMMLVMVPMGMSTMIAIEVGKVTPMLAQKTMPMEMGKLMPMFGRARKTMPPMAM